MILLLQRHPSSTILITHIFLHYIITVPRASTIYEYFIFIRLGVSRKQDRMPIVELCLYSKPYCVQCVLDEIESPIVHPYYLQVYLFRVCVAFKILYTFLSRRGEIRPRIRAFTLLPFSF
jgi:hypothetical protein